jgi:quercetin dioxygenase-like cupin family protein
MPSRAQETTAVRLETDRLKATEHAFAPGAETGWHVHAYDYVVVPLTDGRLLIEEPGGATRYVELKAGIPYARNAGVEHNVVNAGDGELRFLEVELLPMNL